MCTGNDQGKSVRLTRIEKHTVKKVTATEGDPVCLPADLTKIEKDDKIQWYYEDENYEKNVIAEFKAGDREPHTFPGADVKFRGKLKMEKTGDLIITDIRTIYSGLYILMLSNSSNSRRAKYKRFNVSVKSNEESVVVGGSVTLPSARFDAKIETDDLILWTFGAEKRLVATNAAGPDKTDERFRGRVELDEKTGSLTISDIKAEDIGHYNLQIINSKETKGWRVNVILSAKKESVVVGGSVTLRPDQPIAKTETGDLILWAFGAKKSLIATNAARPDKTDERFTDRVELNRETGSLTISDIRAEDTGHYKLQIINSKETKGWRFNLILSDSTENESATAENTSLLAGGRNQPQFEMRHTHQCQTL
ncbi:uncharacterized protein LOC125261996 [Megalobrama amblycephala]|uniref:uncharacterized protein LOC125261996 n=1 Tax=Megalobrama amblycephala TaxID=75352 RepID=UPI00201413A9|nr:uncharacterized protein LOC125261996 [Megalobrama amblycephala]